MSAAAERVRLLGLLALFAAGLWPFAGTFLLHYVDERNYTNAAIVMIRTGDYLTPRWPDGEPRLHKPIAAYWAVALGYAMLGIGLAASRLPFIAAGALVVALTYALARELTGRPETALLAAVMTLSQAQVILGSIRSIPDILLCLFMVLSAYGFIGVIALGRRAPHFYWAAYVGAGLAIATKGLLALAFVGYAWLFWLLARTGPRPGWRDLVHLPSMAAGAAIAAWWYGLMYARHGERLLRVFGRDQISANIEASGHPVVHAIAYVGLLAVNLLPWTVLLIPLAIGRRRLAAIDDRQRRARRFILIWSVLMAVIFGFGPIDPRYVLPAGPLLAVVLADAADRADLAVTSRLLSGLMIATLVALAGLGLAFALLHLAAIGPWSAAGVLALFLSVAGVIGLAARDARRLSPAMALGLAVLLAFPLSAIALEPVLRPDAGARAMARDLERARRDPAEPVLLIGSEYMANKLRILTAGRIPIDTWTELSADPSRWPSAMILLSEEAERRDLRGYRTHAVSSDVRRIRLPGLWRAIRERRVLDYLESQRDRYIVATRR